MSCASDPTCCFCAPCFESSPCSALGHRYLMTRSGGGGCCDCGDAEAFKPESFCKRHKGCCGDSGQDSWDRLPESDQKAAAATLEAVVRYCCRVVCKCGPFFTSTRSNGWVTVLHNDSTHEFQAVKRAVKNAAECNDERAMQLTTYAHEKVRSAIKCTRELAMHAVGRRWSST